jgi:hypothetical protein
MYPLFVKIEGLYTTDNVFTKGRIISLKLARPHLARLKNKKALL